MKRGEETERMQNKVRTEDWEGGSGEERREEKRRNKKGGLGNDRSYHRLQADVLSDAAVNLSETVCALRSGNKKRLPERLAGEKPDMFSHEEKFVTPNIYTYTT